MLQKFEQAQARFGGRHHAIDAWLTERREVLLAYCRLSGLPTSPDAVPDRRLPAAQAVQSFCALLMDYISAGHFEIYERLLGELELSCHQQAKQEAQRLLPLLTATTDAVLAFDDIYGEAAVEAPCWATLDRELSGLGETLALRFDYEDELLSLLAQSEQAA